MSANPEQVQFGPDYRLGRVVEHITMESDDEVTPAPARLPQRRTVRAFILASRLQRYVTELTILEGHQLAVRRIMPDGRRSEYQVDLRFASPSPVRVRNIPWAWLAATAVLAALGAAALQSAWSSGVLVPGPYWTAGFLAVSFSMATLFASACHATESLQIRSVHGDAPLAAVTGAIGATRCAREFFAELSGTIETASRARPQHKQQFLCDQMREHHRLHRLAVLSDAEYEASKARILAAH